MDLNRFQKMLKMLMIDSSEILLEINIGPVIISSIEIKNDAIILHQFKDNIDIEISFMELEIEYQKIIYDFINQYIYN